EVAPGSPAKRCGARTSLPGYKLRPILHGPSFALDHPAPDRYRLTHLRVRSEVADYPARIPTSNRDTALSEERPSTSDKALSQDRMMDHLHLGNKICARLARRKPKAFWIQAYFQDRRGLSSRPPRLAARDSISLMRSRRSA